MKPKWSSFLAGAVIVAGSAWSRGGEAEVVPAPPHPCPPPVAPLAVRLVPVEPVVTLRPGEADARATPFKHGCAYTGGGNIDVRQPAPDTLIITMTGAAVGGGLPASVAGFNFDLTQQFEVVAESPAFCGATLSVQGRLIGLLRNPCKGTALCSDARVGVAAGEGPAAQEVLSLMLPGMAVGDKDNQSVLVRKGPITIPVEPGCYTLRQTWAISASQPLGSVPGKPASAEFAPAPALDPTWISYKDPFHGVAKKDFGFQVIVKVTPVKSTAAPLPTQMKVIQKPDAEK